MAKNDTYLRAYQYCTTCDKACFSIKDDETQKTRYFCEYCPICDIYLSAGTKSCPVCNKKLTILGDESRLADYDYKKCFGCNNQLSGLSGYYSKKEIQKTAIKKGTATKDSYTDEAKEKNKKEVTSSTSSSDSGSEGEKKPSLSKSDVSIRPDESKDEHLQPLDKSQYKDYRDVGDPKDTSGGITGITSEDKKNKKEDKSFWENVTDTVSSAWNSVKKFFESDDNDDSETEEDKKAKEDYVNTFSLSNEDILKLSLYGGVYGYYNVNLDDSDNELSDEEKAIKSQMNDVFKNLEGTDKIPDGARLDNILGLPLSYNNFSDPGKRVFQDTLLYDCPLIYFVPGKPKINKKLINTSGEFVGVEEYYKKIDNGTENENGIFATLSALKGDSRYISFKENYSEYYKYVQIMFSYVYSYIYTSDDDTQGFKLLEFSDVFDQNYKDSGVCFYCDKATTFSESADNTYSSSRIAEQVNGESSTIREISMTAYRNGFTSWINSIITTFKNVTGQVASAVQSGIDFEAMLTNTSNRFIRVVNGAQLDFPEIWEDSKFNRSYDISFKFYSPYGDKRSVMKYVYTPFLALLGLTLPRQDQAFSYIEPFIVRVIKPGAFNIDMGNTMPTLLSN